MLKISAVFLNLGNQLLLSQGFDRFPIQRVALFDNNSRHQFCQTDPKIFLKAPNFEGEVRAKKRFILVKKFQKVPKNACSTESLVKLGSL